MSARVLACATRSAQASMQPWWVLLASVMADSRAMKVASICCICACASTSWPLASVCLKMTSLSRRCTSSSWRRLSGWLAAARSAWACPCIQRSSWLRAAMLSNTMRSSSSSSVRMADWSSVAKDRR